MKCASLLRSVLFLQLGIYANSIVTDPPVTTNGGTVDLPAVENAINVSVFCNVTFQGTPIVTGWRLLSIGMTPQPIGVQLPNFVVENVARRTNLTILSFTRSNLDMMMLQCLNGFVGDNEESAFFIPRFIG